MPQIVEARTGERLSMKKQAIAFSLWPVGRTKRRYGVQHRVFAADPWPIIAEAIAQRCPKQLREPAQAFCAQAEDFYEASLLGRVLHAKPVLLYYCMLNLAKAFILTTGRGAKDYRPQHGLRETASLGQVEGAPILAFPTTGKRPQLFADFLQAVSGQQLKRNRRYRLGEILPQILSGHRVWCSAAQAKERFVGIHELRFLKDSTARSIWVQAVLRKEDLAPLGITYAELLRGTRLGPRWRIARVPAEPDVVCLEKKLPDSYTHRPSDVLMNVVDGIRHSLWSCVLIVPPYLRYYLYVPPREERARVLPQLLSMYMVMFFLGSITRYRPHHFDRLLDSEYGAQIEGILNEVPTQFIYLLSSQFLKRDVAKAAIV
ncbi:MAG: YaaC family protein [Terriglobia bacterium]